VRIACPALVDVRELPISRRKTTAMFYHFQKEYGTGRALEKMEQVFNRDYPSRGMAFAMGTHSRFPDVWLLVGVIRLDKISQLSLAL
jgi:hypothetical protein